MPIFWEYLENKKIWFFFRKIFFSGQSKLWRKQKKGFFQQGFTLIELLVVGGIIAVLSTGILVSFSRMSNYSFVNNQGLRVENLIKKHREKLRIGEYDKIEFSFEIKNTNQLLVKAKCFKNNTNSTEKIDLKNEVSAQMEYNEYKESTGVVKENINKLNLVLTNNKLGVLTVNEVNKETSASNPNFRISASEMMNPNDFLVIITLEKQGAEKIIEISKESILYRLN